MFIRVCFMYILMPIGVESPINAVMVARHLGAFVAHALYKGVTGSFIVEKGLKACNCV